jgi:hypothetical protein
MSSICRLRAAGLVRIEPPGAAGTRHATSCTSRKKVENDAVWPVDEICGASAIIGAVVAMVLWPAGR